MTQRAPAKSPLDACVNAEHEAFVAERPADADEDVHMLASIVDHVIERCTRVGDVVFDPFAGFGTTLARSAALGRKGIGIELLPERVEILRTRAPGAHIIEGDARELLRILRTSAPHLIDGGVELVLTSPPYMTSNAHEPDPLTAYEKGGGDYSRYLAELGLVAQQLARIVKPGGFVVWNVADILHEGRTTHLISDCAEVLEQHLRPVGVTEIVWDRHPHDLIRDALLVFQRPAVRGSGAEIVRRPGRESELSQGCAGTISS